jgi:alpha-ribazole phosphatase
MEIYLVRHPPPIDVEGLCYGRLDVAVDEREVAKTAAAVLTAIPAASLAHARIHCSPSSRCVSLARRIAAPREPTPAEDLMEMNFGDWQGVRWDAVARAELDAWAKDIWEYRPGGGESSRMVAARWERWLCQLREARGAIVVAVTHAGVIRVALAHSSAGGAAAALGAHIPFGSVHRLDLG